MDTIRRIGNGQPELIPAAEKLSLDELYSQADTLGRVEIGGIGDRNKVEIRVSSLSDDYVCIREKGCDLKLNLHRAISRAKDLIEFYRSRGW